ncbi:metal-sulfur cluster assembly factor [Paraburkholderia dinghuensis]|uniref:Metal-sulfur cluster assembly factor n=1 Tax=Paraburkholderia dinghuensis TaxID=2305225 RepID=A0A3N6P6P1_9BURK|nr:metal-sulfur cluster assembly factor [Paraburkholderia dinghuensis]RQH09623.1 metal-sulfur cluster assembly factor [Paraburkholderia dinghuensis]
MMSPADNAALPSESEIREALRYVIDPEVGVNIVDLGLVYRVDVSPEMLEIDIAPTSPACPMGEVILDDAREVVDALTPASMAINIKLVWEPPWDPAMMTDAARRVLGWSDE